LPRLLDLKVESYLIASTVNIAIGQRLVRRICPACKQARKITDSEIKSLQGIIPREMLQCQQEFYFGRGCEKCGGTGYRGRIGIYEVLAPDVEIRRAVLVKADASEIRAIAFARGMTAMIEDGFAKAQAGITTIEEVLRMLYE